VQKQISESHFYLQ